MSHKIMIVDDSAFARSFIIRSLGICGLEDADYIEAATGKEALDLTNSKHIDYIFTDLNMPDMTGEELLDEVKKHPKKVHIPVVVVTSLKNPARERKLIEKNATAVLDKPIVLIELEKVVKNKLKLN